MTNSSEEAKPPLFLYNTLTRTKERFTPLKDDFVRMYNCGPTVYHFVHIGNLRSYVFADTLRRTLVANGYKVMQVMNITDVGHLTSDGDEGEDKMSVGLAREGLPFTLEGMRELADRYTAAFLEDLTSLGIKRPSALPRASEHIAADIALIETLMQKEYAYRTSGGVYFDTSRFPAYGKLGGVDVSTLKEGARVGKDDEKRHPSDFALWKRNDTLGWESPWGRGFPGWHIECSAMAMEHLGKELDIHTGGIDHIGTHHNNEIAQSEAASGKPFARFWMHNEFIKLEGMKISKSLRNTISLRQLTEHGHAPLAYRYWLLGGHYRSPMNFSFDALEAAEKAFVRIHRVFAETLGAEPAPADASYALRLLMAMNDDLDTPKALALLWELAKDMTLTPAVRRATLLHFDKMLGLGLVERAQSGVSSTSITVAMQRDETPEEVQTLLDERERARKDGDYAKADALRAELLQRGYTVLDTSEGPVATRKK